MDCAIVKDVGVKRYRKFYFQPLVLEGVKFRKCVKQHNEDEKKISIHVYFEKKR